MPVKPVVEQSLSDIAKEVLQKYLDKVPFEFYSSDPLEAQAAITECTNFQLMIEAWSKALHWTDNLEYGLCAVLATITSTMSIGDQLWIRLLGPAGSGKSRLAEAVSRNKKYVLAKSTIRGFHSGFSQGNEDVSLISQVSGKTLIIKDGDTLLQAPNLPQILSEARDVFDTNSRTSYRNNASKDYEGVRMTFVLCGTSSLRSLDESELGERFLTVTMMDGIDKDLEDKILWSMIDKLDSNMGIAVDKEANKQVDADIEQAMALTAGYVSYLREVAQDEMSKTTLGGPTKKLLITLAKFIAYMRARPSTRQDSTAERELATRLLSQLTRMTKALAVAMQGDIDGTHTWIKRIAFDTAQGFTLDLCRVLHDKDEGEGVSSKGLAIYMGVEGKKTSSLLQFLRQIGVVARRKEVSGVGKATKITWKLKKEFRELWEDLH